MDLTKLLTRLPLHANNKILVYEKGHLETKPFGDVREDIMAACQRLAAAGVKPGMRVGIQATNCYEWIVYDLALIELRAVSVAFTEDFGSTPAKELFEKYDLSLLLVGPDEDPRSMGQSVPVVAMNNNPTEIRTIDRGEPPADINFRTPCLIFSSGSAGGLKGLVLNRFGIEASVESFAQAVSPQPYDSLLLFLPMSNFQQRMMYYAALWYGFDVIVTEPSQLFRALKKLRPTILIAPPALYESVEVKYDSQPSWKRRTADLAGKLALRLPHRGLRTAAGKAVFKRVHEAFGGRMRFMVTGMAPIKRSALELFERMQLPLFETYGLIECGSISLNLPGASKIGSVGRLLPRVGVELADDGEIIARREPPLALGYFECAEGENERTFLGGDRIATGDIGFFDNEGYLCLLGRKKEMIITSGGEKVHPEVLESDIDACPDVAKAVVLPGSQGSPLTAVVLPKDPQDMIARMRIERFVRDIGRHRSFPGVGNVIFTDTRLSRDNGFLRPNLKLDRRRIARHFQGLIEEETQIVEKPREAANAD